MKVQIGPVQEFIAQARSTRDMWAGSYLLSWLTAAAMKVFKDAGCEFVFPVLDDQPLYKMFNGDPTDAGLIPTLPNVFMLLVPQGKEKEMADQARFALKDELKKIGDACWEGMLKLGASEDWKNRWDTQLVAFPIINWHAVEETGNWKADVEQLGKEMAARRMTRDFEQWGGEAGASKDVLSGKEEIIGGEKFWGNDSWKGAGPLGAMNCVKRLFPEAYLEGKFSSKKSFWSEMSMYNTRDIAAGNREGIKGKDKNDEDKPVNPYMAVIAMDGDRMGKALKQLKDQSAHTEFSQTLAQFAKTNVMRVLTQFKFQQSAQLVYAGGDDVLVMCPADQALALAKALRDEFIDTMKAYIDPEAEEKMDASCGIAVGHYKFPLQRIVEEARKAESRAKNDRGRGAFAMSLFKRSGEIIHWGGKWESPALELYRLYTKMAEPDTASSRFPYALAELLAPYRLSRESDAAVSMDQLREIVKKEYAHVRSRQTLVGSEEEQKKMDELAASYLATVFSEKGEKSGGIPTDFSNLFLASAFMNRQRGEN
ncbi:MAG: type III-B CRISPR-associated protein Cas10/Cmr2 [Lentisphaerae bacterium]|nr:type III-B CRISPR-associated protein Cas10/Cmr2 [Lentisphaerota bacterium]